MSILIVVPILAVLGGLSASGYTALSRTSRAAAYVTLAELIEGTVWKRKAWPKALFNMVGVLLVHALGVAVFVALTLYLLYIILQRLGVDVRSLLRDASIVLTSGCVRW
jgi:hypothetical protein